MSDAASTEAGAGEAPADPEVDGDTPSNATLVRRADDGDERAARQLFDRYRDAVMGHCLLSTDGDRDAAKDLVQESFATVFQKLGDLRDPENFSSWLWTIVRRECADRGSQRTRHVEVLEKFAIERDVVMGEAEGAAQKAMRERRIECVREMLDEVDDEQLEAIVKMKYTPPEHTTREIAEELEMPHGTVTVKLMRFRESIEEELAEQLERVDSSDLRPGGAR